jgi:hypothetical protein
MKSGVPTLQQDTGGLGIASNTVWPATPFGGPLRVERAGQPAVSNASSF